MGLDEKLARLPTANAISSCEHTEVHKQKIAGSLKCLPKVIRSIKQCLTASGKVPGKRKPV